jgi:LysM repeat protein
VPVRHAAPSPDRKALIAFGILAALIVVATFQLTRLGGGSDRSHLRADGASAPTSAPKTTSPPPTTRPAINDPVQRGETLTVIARRFGVSIDALVAANRLADEDHLSEGQLLVVPPPPPVALAVTPPITAPGRSVQLKLAGAQPSEAVSFQVDSPTGTFTGPSHTAPADGTVTTTYSVAVDAPTGTYTVTARGDRGTTVQTTFRVDPSVPTS